MIPNNFKKTCVRIVALLMAFPISVLLTSSNLIPGGISSDFIWEERKFKKLWIQVESLTLFFGLPFWAAFTLRIILPIIPFWSSWTLSNYTFWACRIKLFNRYMLIALCLLMVVDMTEPPSCLLLRKKIIIILWLGFEIFIIKKRQKSLFCRHFYKHCFSCSLLIPAKCL